MVSLHSILDLRVECKEADNIVPMKILSHSLIILPIQPDIIHIHIVSLLNDVVKGVIKQIVQEVEIPILISDGRIDQVLLHGDSLLVIDESHVEGEVPYLAQNIIWVGETIPDPCALETFKEPIGLFLLCDVGGDGWNILPGVALSEDEERGVGPDVQVFRREAAVLVVVEFVQGFVKVS